MISTESNHVLAVTATDQAGNAATATRMFLLDKSVPVLTLTSQVPAGTYLRGMLTFTVTGDDALASMGSIAANIGVAATLNSAPVAPGLSYPVISGGRRQVVATFAAGALADGALRLTFTLTDRAGNVASPLTLNLTVDNTAPTGVAITGIDTSTGDREFWDATLATRFVNTVTPTLLGTYTEANPGATVAVTIGTTAAGATTSATAWRATVPAGSVTSAGNDATVTITDAAGNATSVTQRLRSDLARPTVDSPAAALVHDEAGDMIAIGITKPWSHNHTGTNVSLGGPGATCPELHKYAYLTAASPEAEETGGAGPSGSNPITFNWSAADGGAGIQQATLRYVVRTPGGATRGPYTVTGPSGTPVSFNFVTPLYRNTDPLLGIPELGVPGLTEEGTFSIDVYADDRVGNTSLVATRCWVHRPRGVPVSATTPTALGTESAFGDALSNLALASNHSISALLNGTHAGAGFMTYTVENPTSDDVWVSFAPSAASVTYTKDWRYYRTNVAEATASVNCTYDGADFVGTGGTPDARCPGTISGTLTGGNEAVVNGTFAVVPADLTVRVWEERVGPMYFEIPACTATTACLGRFQLAAHKKYRVVVGAKGIPALRQTGVSSGYSELVRTSDPVDYSAFPPTATITMLYNTVNRTSTPPQPLSQSGAAVDQACNRWINIANPAYRCNRVATYQAVKYLFEAKATFNGTQAVGTTSAEASLSAASAHLGAVSPTATLPFSTQWTTTEN